MATLCSRGVHWEGTSGNSAVWRGETGERVQRRRQSRWGEKEISIIKEETLGSVLRPTSWRLCAVPTQSHLSKRPWTQSAARLFCFQTTRHKRPHRGHHSSNRKGVRLHLELATELASIIHVTLVCRHPKCKSQRTVESCITVSCHWWQAMLTGFPTRRPRETIVWSRHSESLHCSEDLFRLDGDAGSMRHHQGKQQARSEAGSEERTPVLQAVEPWVGYPN